MIKPVTNATEWLSWVVCFRRILLWEDFSLLSTYSAFQCININIWTSESKIAISLTCKARWNTRQNNVRIVWYPYCTEMWGQNLVRVKTKATVHCLGYRRVIALSLKVSSLTLFRKWYNFLLFSEMLPPENDFQRGKMSWISLGFKTVKVDFISDNRKLWLRFTLPKQCGWNIKTTSWNIQTE